MRKLTDSEGIRYVYGYNLFVGMSISFFVGILASILGIGGGIIHVPAMVSVLNFPVHIATATSHFVLAIMAMVGTAVHVIDGSLGKGELHIILPLCIGAVFGAKIGAKLSRRIHGLWIMRSLACALGLVGIRILILAIVAISK